MNFTLLIDMEPDEFDQLAWATSITAPLTTLEVVQADGLLTRNFRVSLIDRLSTQQAGRRGIAQGGVPIQVWIEGEADGQEDR